MSPREREILGLKIMPCSKSDRIINPPGTFKVVDVSNNEYFYGSIEECEWFIERGPRP